MSLEPDLVIDRRRLKRRLALWRGFAVLLVLAGGLAWAGRSGGGVRGAVSYFAALNWVIASPARMSAKPTQNPAFTRSPKPSHPIRGTVAEAAMIQG